LWILLYCSFRELLGPKSPNFFCTLCNLLSLSNCLYLSSSFSSFICIFSNAILRFARLVLLLISFFDAFKRLFLFVSISLAWLFPKLFFSGDKMCYEEYFEKLEISVFIFYLAFGYYSYKTLGFYADTRLYTGEAKKSKWEESCSSSEWAL